MRPSASDTRAGTIPSMAVISPLLMLSTMLPRRRSMQDRALITSLRVPRRRLLRFESHLDEETPPKSEITDSTSLLTLSTSLSALVLSTGSFFHELMIGTKATTSEDIEDTLETAASVTALVVGGIVIVLYKLVKEEIVTVVVETDTLGPSVWDEVVNRGLLLRGLADQATEEGLVTVERFVMNPEVMMEVVLGLLSRTTAR